MPARHLTEDEMRHDHDGAWALELVEWLLYPLALADRLVRRIRRSHAPRR